jgi:hypothetical protein
LKIYSDDPNLPYKTTKLKALYTKSEIDGLFAKWGVKDVYWRWDPEHNDVFLALSPRSSRALEARICLYSFELLMGSSCLP